MADGSPPPARGRGAPPPPEPAMAAFLDALLLGAGYNAALVAIGAALLGLAAGVAGTFLHLRRRALVSDAVAHATLPGVALAWLAMVMLGGDGRSLPGLLAGAALSAALGLLALDWITRRTRLGEDAAIGAVLSVAFGLGIVLLTVIQNVQAGRPAGLETFLLGSTAGMLRADATVIALGGLAAILGLLLLRRPLTMVAFDPAHAEALGIGTRRADLALMGLALAVMVIGLRVAGLVLVVALLIVPAVTARLWAASAAAMAATAAGLGATAGWIGAAISAAAPALPTGPIIVLVLAGLFLLSLLLAPERGLLAALWRRRRLRHRIHRRQGLLALAHGEPILEPLTLALLRREGLIRPDGVATEAGRALAARTLRDERRWQVARAIHAAEAAVAGFDGLRPIGEVLTADEIAEIDRRLGPPAEAPR